MSHNDEKVPVVCDSVVNVVVVVASVVHTS